jgi:glycine betaine/proline transport system substrate-binding protein
VTPDSAEDLEMQFIDAQERRLPVFGYYYAPTALMGRLEVVSWMILNEPEYTTRCWREIEAALDDPTYTAREACAYDSRPILKGAHSGLRDRAPEIAEVLQEIDLGSHPVSLSAAWVHDNGIDPVTDWERVAEYYLGAFESRWIKWVSDDAAKRIRAALERS